MNKLADSPAFPVSDSAVHALGLTKREFFAGLAMQGLLANSSPEQFTCPEAFADYAAKCSDALLAELAKPSAQPEPPEPYILEKTIAALTEISAHLYTDQDRARCREMAAQALIELNRRWGKSTSQSC